MILLKIDKDIINAMKEKNTSLVNSLRYAKSLLQENTKSDKKREEVDVLLSYKKTLEKSLEAFKDHPEELAKIKYDIDVLQAYLPKQMTEDEVMSIILEIKESKGITEFSQLMKESMSSLKGKADGKLVTSIVKGVLDKK